MQTKPLWTWAIALAVVVSILAPVRLPADQVDDKYLGIFKLITQADQLGQRGQADVAKAKYLEAQKALANFKKEYPTYNPKVVTYRLDYLDKQLDALAQSAIAAEAAAASKAAAKGLGQCVLLEPGAEPRQVLRLHPKSGEKQTVAMTVTMSMGMQMPNVPMQMVKLPAMVLTVGVTPTEISAEGDVQFDLVFEDVDVAAESGSTPEMAEAMKAQLAGVKGLTITRVLTDRGFSIKTEMKIPPGSTAEVRKAMEEMKESFSATEILLPEEPVGVGARWEVKRKLRTSGMALDQTAIFDLDSVEGNVIKTKASVQQRAANQKIAHPMIPQAKVDLLKLTGTGEMGMTVDLGKILPVRGTVDDTTEMTLGLDAGGQKQTMPMKTETKVQLETK